MRPNAALSHPRQAGNTAQHTIIATPLADSTLHEPQQHVPPHPASGHVPVQSMQTSLTSYANIVLAASVLAQRYVTLAEMEHQLVWRDIMLCQMMLGGFTSPAAAEIASAMEGVPKLGMLACRMPPFSSAWTICKVCSFRVTGASVAAPACSVVRSSGLKKHASTSRETMQPRRSTPLRTFACGSCHSMFQTPSKVQHPSL